MSNASQRIADLSPEERRALLAKLLRKEANESQSLQPLSYNQQGIWFLYQLAPESRVYNVNFAARIRSDVDIPALRRAFQALVDRHPALRTTFCVRSGKPAQRVHPHLAGPLRRDRCVGLGQRGPENAAARGSLSPL